ncbi:MAG: hypothetical protein ACRD5B_08340 [Nitrososphaeraceae archaeon]
MIDAAVSTGYKQAISEGKVREVYASASVSSCCYFHEEVTSPGEYF